MKNKTEPLIFTFKRETLFNEYGNDYGFLYKIKCSKEQYSNSINIIIREEIGEDWYYNPSRNVWEQIKFEWLSE